MSVKHKATTSRTNAASETLECFNVGDVVRPATRQDALAMSDVFGDDLTTAHEFKVCVVVDSGLDYRGSTAGLIVNLLGHKPTYPYVWNVERFTLVEKYPDVAGVESEAH